MLFVELALQGVRGFSPAVRVPLKDGYTCLTAPPSNATPLSALCLELCFPTGGGDKSLIAPGAKAGKAGLLLQGNDQGDYRIIKELGAGGSLHRLNAQTKAYELVTTNAAEIGEFLRLQAGMPDRSAFEQLFCFRSDLLPSRRPQRQAKQGMQGTQTSAWAEMLEDKPTMDPALKLRELEAELEISTEVEQLQFRLDGITNEAFQLERVIASTDPLEAKLAEATAAYEAAPTPEKLGLPADIMVRAERMPVAEARFADALNKLKSERSAEEAAQRSVPPLTREKPFWAAIGLGVLALVVGGFTSGYVKFIAGLDLVPFGYAAFLAWRYVDDLQFLDRTRRKDSMLGDREKKIREQFEAETHAVRVAMKAVKADNPQEVIEAFRANLPIIERMERLQAELDIARSEPEYANAGANLELFRKQQEALQVELEEKGAYARPAREVQREIDKVKVAMGQGRREVSAVTQVSKITDPTPELFAQASPLFGTDEAALGAMLKDRSSQYFTALTERRWAGLDFTADGDAIALGGSGKSALWQLPPRDVDWAYFAMRLTLLEKYLARFKVPVLIEPFLETMDEAKNPLLARMLKNLGTLSQVLHVTAHPAFTAAAQGSVSV